MSQIIMHRGPNVGATYDLSGEVISIGRGIRNDIVIHDNEVSREHCRLTRVMADYEIEDMNSNRGTFVNGQPVIGSWLLQPGHIIQLGDSIVFEYQRVRTGETAEMYRVEFERSDVPHLVVVTGSEVGKTFDLDADELSLGRHLSNDIVIQDPEVSRHHLRLKRDQKGEYVVKDLNSTNGTWVNEDRLEDTRLLKNGDIIRIGSLLRLNYTWAVQIFNPDKLPDTDALVTFDTQPVETAGRSTGLMSLSARETELGTGFSLGALVNHVFVAYARDDWETVVAPMTAHLQDAGIKVWVDQYLVRGETDWVQTFEQALAECRLMIVVVSPEAFQSRYIKLAYRYFYNREKPMLLFVHHNVSPLPPELHGLHKVIFDPTNTDRSFKRLIHEVLQTR